MRHRSAPVEDRARWECRGELGGTQQDEPPLGSYPFPS